MSEPLIVEVAYAKPDQQWLLALTLPATATVADAIAASQLLEKCPELATQPMNAGIFGRVTPLDQPLKSGDRVEIYRPLHLDPKEARRRRATHV